MIVVISGLAVLIIIVVCYRCDRVKSKFWCISKKFTLPPGPWGFPIFGFMPFLIIGPQKVLHILANKYGKIFTIYLGKYRVIVLNDYNVIKEAFKEDVFSGRPDLKMLEVRNGGVRRGLVCSEGREWNEQRKFTMRQLKDLGFGKQSMECLVQEEVEELIERLRTDLGKPILLQSRFNLAVLNVIWRITCGERYPHDDERLQNILQKTKADLAETQYTGPLLFLPWLIETAPQVTRWNAFVNSIKAVHEFLQGIIESHKQAYDSSNKRDFIDVYFSEIEKTTDKESSFYKERGEQSLLVVLLDLFMAGADTTSTTLSWAFLYMILNKRVQRKVQDEIDKIIGHQTPTVDHRKKMPYTEATIMEILRKSCLVPMGLFHCTTSDTKFSGYDIPKNSVIMANFYSLHYNREYWGDPQNFRPERFLDEYNRLRKFDAFLPFSTGKRVCPGESLARDELFLFITNLLQNFDFTWDVQQPKPTENYTCGVILCPKKYLVVVNERKPALDQKQTAENYIT